MEPITAKRCEMRARLFDGEIEFPPFDFLNGDEPALFDFENHDIPRIPIILKIGVGW